MGCLVQHRVCPLPTHLEFLGKTGVEKADIFPMRKRWIILKDRTWCCIVPCNSTLSATVAHNS